MIRKIATYPMNRTPSYDYYSLTTVNPESSEINVYETDARGLLEIMKSGKEFPISLTGRHRAKRLERVKPAQPSLV